MTRRLPTFLRAQEAERMFHAAHDPRDRLAIALMLSEGLRVSECVHVRIEHLDLDNRTIFLQAGKGQKDAYLPLNESLLPILRAYLQGQGHPHRGYLFPSPRYPTRPISKRHIQARISAIAEEAGIERRITPHALRHTFATLLLAEGAPITDVQALLRHSKLATTAIYLHCVTEHLAASINRINLPTGQTRLWAVANQ